MNATLLGFIKKELIQTLRDKRMRVMLFVVPCIQMTLFGVAITNEVKNIPLAAFYDSRDTVMHKVYEHAIASGWFVPASASAEQDPFTVIQAGSADVVLLAPPGGLTREIGRGQGRLQVLINAINVIQAQAVENYLRVIMERALREDQGSAPPPQPIAFDVRILYNPSLDTAIFMVPGVMCIVMVMSTLMLSMAAIVREKELGTFETLIAAPVFRYEVVYGKMLPYVLVGMFNVPLVLGVALLVFGVPMRGSFLVLALAALIFICTCVAMGTLISTFCKNQQQSNLAGFLFLFPAIMFSGLMFPLENMPKVLTWVAYLDPLAHYLGLLRNIMLKGGGTDYLLTHLGALLLMTVGCLWVSLKRFHTTLG